MLLSAWMTRGFLHFFLFLCSTTNLTLNNFYVDISQHRSLIIILNKCTRTSCRAPSAWCRSALCGRTWAGRASSCASSPGTSSWAAQATWWTGSAGTAPRLSSVCSRSTLPARTSTLETKFGDVTVQIKCKSRVLLPISDCCRGRWCSPRGSWRAGSWRRGAWRSPSCGRAAPGTCPRPADTRQYKKLFSFLSYCELLKITHNNNLPLSGPGVSPTSFPSSVHWASWLYPTEDLCCCSRSSSGSVTKLPLSSQGGCGRGQMES